MTIKKYVTFLLVALFSAMSQANSNVTTPIILGERDQLVVDLMKLAFEKSNYRYQMNAANEWLSVNRLKEEVKHGNMSVMWAGASTELQGELEAVKIPLFKGLAGYRLFVIEKNAQHRFNGINSLNQLKQLTAGLGRFWGDTQILETAGLEVVKPVKAESLFYMVDGGRFDYLPLAMHEIWEVVETHNDLNLAVENGVVLQYPMAMYLYVDKNNRELHRALEQGLEAAIADGSFDKMFYGSKVIASAMELAQIDRRNIIRIANHSLPADAPLSRKELWLDPQRKL
ncbi:diguanylate cyclase [Neiella sp. HB171785]|uniref:Diguanylate cyclase n=1 Tax=Neiella litorisoli TaxID=2771431 RepID=A0A8J6UGW9_9GAMM|nr:diguanylate cyclase [Neiella litorisoli]MBD1390886.1 diguanylate cyclase [Neiella litorisoli]